MNGGRTFDDIAKLVATTSRRGALRLAMGGMSGALLARSGASWIAEEAAAACRPGTRCQDDAQCCTGAVCTKHGRCRCRSGRANCGGACRELQTDRRHCGKCGRRCAKGERCVAGTCEPRVVCIPRNEPCGPLQGDRPCCGTDFCVDDGFCAACMESGAICDTTRLPEGFCCGGACDAPSGQRFGTCR